MKSGSHHLIFLALTFLAAGLHAGADDGLSALLNQNASTPAAQPSADAASSSPPPIAVPMSPVLAASSVNVPAAASPAPPDALDRVNIAIRLHPNDVNAYIIRGDIYGERKMWLQSQSDYEKALSIDPHNVVAKINLAEIAFRQKQYDQSRALFAALEGDPDMGDFASYMVFLCDLFAAHAAAAGRELATFNADGENASYYFSNVAWDIFHQNNAGARDFLHSAVYIFPPHKVSLYESNLVESGYLPLKD